MDIILFTQSFKQSFQIIAYSHQSNTNQVTWQCVYCMYMDVPGALEQRLFLTVNKATPVDVCIVCIWMCQVYVCIVCICMCQVYVCIVCIWMCQVYVCIVCIWMCLAYNKHIAKYTQTFRYIPCNLLGNVSIVCIWMCTAFLNGIRMSIVCIRTCKVCI